MNPTPQTRYYYPNKLGRIILLGMEEILGHNGYNAVLNTAGMSGRIGHLPPNDLEKGLEFGDLSKLQITLEKMYGPRGGHGVELRVGRACFKHGLREFGEALGLTDSEFHLLPLNEKILTGTELLAELFNQTTDQIVRIEDAGANILWHIERCPVCWGREAPEPVCHLAVGILQEALFCVSSGRYYCVEETRCAAMGDNACTIEIDKRPLE